MSRFGMTAALIVLASLVRPSFAEEPLKLAVGGPAIAAELKARSAEMDKALGRPVDVKVVPFHVSIAAVSKGLIDGAIMGASVGEAVSEANKKDAALGLKAGDFEEFVFQKISAYAYLHPDNPVSALSHGQFADVLAGKVKNWKELGGKDLPITVLSARNYVSIHQAISREFLDGKQSPVMQNVIDKDGLLKRLKADPSIICFGPKVGAEGGFQPKLIETGAFSVINYVLKKSPSAGARSLADYMKGFSVSK